MKQCLIVDDSRMTRRVAGRILKDLNFQTHEAENGDEALKICRTNMPDAILLDWNMPIMNGIDFLQTLREEPDGAKPIVVFCTSERDIDKITQAISAGADEYIMKPFDSDIIEGKFLMTGLLSE